MGDKNLNNYVKTHVLDLNIKSLPANYKEVLSNIFKNMASIDDKQIKTDFKNILLEFDQKNPNGRYNFCDEGKYNKWIQPLINYWKIIEYMYEYGFNKLIKDNCELNYIGDVKYYFILWLFSIHKYEKLLEGVDPQKKIYDSFCNFLRGYQLSLDIIIQVLLNVNSTSETCNSYQKALQKFAKVNDESIELIKQSLEKKDYETMTKILIYIVKGSLEKIFSDITAKNVVRITQDKLMRINTIEKQDDIIRNISSKLEEIHNKPEIVRQDIREVDKVLSQGKIQHHPSRYNSLTINTLRCCPNKLHNVDNREMLDGTSNTEKSYEKNNRDISFSHDKERSHKRSDKKRSHGKSDKKRSHKRSDKERSHGKSDKKRSHERSSKERSHGRSDKGRLHERSDKERSYERSSKERSRKRSNKERSRKRSSKERSHGRSSKEKSHKRDSKGRLHERDDKGILNGISKAQLQNERNQTLRNNGIDCCPLGLRNPTKGSQRRNKLSYKEGISSYKIKYPCCPKTLNK